jgi:hypothetical protein
MDVKRAPCVAGLFKSHEQAEAARQDLRRIGLADDAVKVSIPEPGSYGVEHNESGDLGRGIVIGIAIGIPVGSGVAISLLLAAVPGMSRMAAIGLGIVIGSYWGLFFGGLGGMVPKVLAHAHDEPRHEIAPDSREVLLIAEAGSRANTAQKVMRRRGASCFLDDVTDCQPRRVPIAAAS